MTLKEYANKIYHKIKLADSSEQIEIIINEAISKLEVQGFSKKEIEEFKQEIKNCFSYIKEAQENSKTLENQKKAMQILSKGKN